MNNQIAQTNVEKIDSEMNLNPEAFKEIITEGEISLLEDDLFFMNKSLEETKIIDVRSTEEIRRAHLRRFFPSCQLSILSVPEQVLTHMNKRELKKNFGINDHDTLLCLCAKGGRSLSAQKHLSVLGFDTFNVAGGLKSLLRLSKLRRKRL